MDRIRNVCIFGGTHGNELSGVYLLRKWDKDADKIRRPTFTTHTCVSNPEAVKLNRRYKDCDLNRQFAPQTLASEITQSTPYEVRRAQELEAMLHNGGAIGPCDFILDLHNTTSNMKACLIYRDSPSDLLTPHVIRYVMDRLPCDTCYAYAIEDAVPADSLRLATHGIGVEIGPQPQGVLRGDVFLLQEQVVMHALDFFEKFNTGTEFSSGQLPVYRFLVRIPYPRDSKGDIVAMVHPSLQDQDWKAIAPSDPVFLNLDGTETTLIDVYPECSSLSQPVYAVFVNEGAYYEKDVAFMLATRITRDLPALKRN